MAPEFLHAIASRAASRDQQYGHWKSVSNRFYRWRDNGTWRRLLEMFADTPDLEWLMIDASHIKAHRRSVATRYAKTTASFLAECQIAAIMLWLR